MGSSSYLVVIILAYAAFVLVWSAMAASVAIFVRDAERRESAYRVLKLVLSTGTGTGGVAALAVHLYQSGLI